MENQSELSQIKKHSYVVTMVLSMLVGVVLVLGTPLFNRFLPEEKTNPSLPVQKIVPHQGIETAGSSL